jgi:glucose/arabinose dehydrogenase
MRRLLLLTLAAAPVFAQPPVGARPFRLEELKTPPGFEVTVFAKLDVAPRLMTFGPNGVLYAAARDAGLVVAVPAGRQPVTVLQGLTGPHSVSFRGNDLYVAVDDGVLRFANAVTDGLVIRSPAERLLTLPAGGQHSSRTAAIGPDDRLYVTAGSTCNFCVETDPRRAAMMRYDADGASEVVLARGLRNSVDFAWHPVTGELWALENGGDGLGDDDPPEEINVIQPGGDYGWPDCIADRRALDWGEDARPGRCPVTQAPEQQMQAHSAPLGITFYTGTQFPEEYWNDAFVAFHGSWNREEPTGYKVVRVKAQSGRAAGVEDFLWGFLDPESRTASGRPVDVVVGPDGALYVSDDHTGNIYRVSYVGPPAL